MASYGKKNIQRVRIKKQKTKSYNYILQDEDGSYNWDHVKIDPFNNEVNTENVKIDESVKTDQDYRGGEDVHKTKNSVSFTKQENKVKQDHHEDIEKRHPINQETGYIMQS